MRVDELEAQIAQLSTGEQAYVLSRIAHALTSDWPGIEKTPGVQGGDACVVRTRIPIWTLESYRRLGWDDAHILANFPTLRPADLLLAWAYVEANLDEIEQALREQAEA